MNFVAGKRRWITIAAIIAVLALTLQNLMNSHTVRYTCNGRYSSEFSGSKDVKNGAIFGIKIERYKFLFNEGAYVHTIMMRDISDQGLGSTSVRYYDVKDGRDNPSISNLGVDQITVTDWTNESENEGVMIVISELTQTLHFVDRSDKGRSIQVFDGRCRKLD